LRKAAIEPPRFRLTDLLLEKIKLEEAAQRTKIFGVTGTKTNIPINDRVSFPKIPGFARCTRV